MIWTLQQARRLGRSKIALPKVQTKGKELKMKQGQMERKTTAFLQDRPDGIAVTDLNIAAALLCAGHTLTALEPKKKNRKEVIFVFKGNKEVLAKRVLEFFKGRVSGERLDVPADNIMALSSLHAQKVRALKSMIAEGCRGTLQATEAKHD